MEKIICVYTEKDAGQKGDIRQKLRDILGLACPVTEKSGTFLGLPVEGYVIHGMTAAELSELEQAQRRPDGSGREKKKARMKTGEGLSRSVRHRQRQFHRTVRQIKKRIQKKEMRDGKGRSGDAFLLCQWRDCLFPPELLVKFYRKCYQENAFVLRAEQLIFLDGWERPGEPEEAEFPFADPDGAERGRRIDWQSDEEAELTLMSEIYSTYNYVTVVTDREEAWQEFAESAYEEYGLSVRCAKDSKAITFRDKKTLIVDMSREGKRCCRCLPQDSIYMDLCGSREKARRIPAKCREIPSLSLRKALDTVMTDTV